MTGAELSPVDENADVLLQPEGADRQAFVEKKVDASKNLAGLGAI